MHSTMANRSMPHPFGAPPAADTEVIQRRGTNAPAPVPAAAPMDRKGR